MNRSMTPCASKARLLFPVLTCFTAPAASILRMASLIVGGVRPVASTIWGEVKQGTAGHLVGNGHDARGGLAVDRV
jgi:hypothetical protein